MPTVVLLVRLGSAPILCCCRCRNFCSLCGRQNPCDTLPGVMTECTCLYRGRALLRLVVLCRHRRYTALSCHLPWHHRAVRTRVLAFPSAGYCCFGSPAGLLGDHLSGHLAGLLVGLALPFPGGEWMRCPRLGHHRPRAGGAVLRLPFRLAPITDNQYNEHTTTIGDGARIR